MNLMVLQEIVCEGLDWIRVSLLELYSLLLALSKYSCKNVPSNFDVYIRMGVGTHLHETG